MSKNMIISIDFDGTIVEHEFPRIGKPMPGAFETMRLWKERGYKLILWTCRENHAKDPRKNYLDQAVEFCRENGIEFDAVNETIEQEDFRHEDYLQHRKPFAKVYVDDSNVGGFPGWNKVYEYVDYRMFLSNVRTIGSLAWTGEGKLEFPYNPSTEGVKWVLNNFPYIRNCSPFPCEEHPNGMGFEWNIGNWCCLLNLSFEDYIGDFQAFDVESKDAKDLGSIVAQFDFNEDGFEKMNRFMKSIKEFDELPRQQP